MKKKQKSDGLNVIPKDLLTVIHGLSNRYTHHRVELVIDEIMNVMLQDDFISNDDLKKALGREVALAFAQGYAKGHDDAKPRIIT